MGSEKEISDVDGNLGSAEKRNAAGMVISNVDYLLVSGSGVFISFCLCDLGNSSAPM